MRRRDRRRSEPLRVAAPIRATGAAATTLRAVTTTHHPSVVAAFDVDHTLTTRDCVGAFLWRIGGPLGFARAATRHPVRLLAALVRRDRDALKAILVGGVLYGRRVDDVRAAGTAFAHLVHAAWLRPDTLARLRWHRDAGHLTVLVSASLEPYLTPLGRLLEVDAVMCAEPLIAGERYGDGLDGPNCRGPEKVRRLDAWLAARGLDGATVWAYGDSAGDRELLARADHATRVGAAPLPATPAASA